MGPLITQIQSLPLQGLQSDFIATTIKIQKLIVQDHFSWHTERWFIPRLVVLLVEQGAGHTCGLRFIIPGFKGCLQQKQRNSVGQLNQLYWRSWALGQQHIPPPRKIYGQYTVLLVCEYLRVLLTQTSQSRAVPCHIQDSWRGIGSPLGGFSLPPSSQSGYCCSKWIYWCQAVSFSGLAEITARFKPAH